MKAHLFLFFLTIFTPLIAQDEDKTWKKEIPKIYIPKNGENWFKIRFGMTWSELEEKHRPKIDDFLLKWRTAYPDDPEAWSSSASWLARNSFMMNMGNVAEGGAYVIDENGNAVSLETGKIIEIPKEVVLVKEKAKEAIVLYEKNIEKFPHRADFYLELANFYIRIEQPQKAVPVMEKLSSAFPKIKDKIEIYNYRKIKDDPEFLVIDLMQQVFITLDQEGGKDAVKLQNNIALLQTRFAPSHILGWNSLAYTMEKSGKPNEVYKALKMALKIDPKDDIVRLNIANKCVELDLDDEALTHWKWLEKNSKDEKLVKRAKAEIKALKSTE